LPAAKKSAPSQPVAHYDLAGATAGLSVTASATALDKPTRTLQLVATVRGGCPEYHFTWDTISRPMYVPRSRGRRIPKGTSYVSVHPPSASSAHNSNLDELIVRLACAVPKAIANRDPDNPWIPCNGQIVFQVFVKDKLGRMGNALVVFLWKPSCLTAAYREAYERQLHALGAELFKIIEGKIGHTAAEKFFAGLLSGAELPPQVHILLLLTGEGKELAIKYQDLREALAAPNCP